MKSSGRVGVLAVALATIALGACEVSPKDHVTSPSSSLVSPKPAIGGGPRLARQVSGAVAMSILADARCDREVTCGHIGPAYKFASREQCVAAIQHDKSGDFTERSCPDGVSESALADCVAAIREEECGGQSAKRENACLAEKFCAR
jgi:hypothetical protein